jgi:DNA adenine methylase
MISQPVAGRYYEPFLGGAALFLALQPTAATLTDTNDDLITTYQAVRDHARTLELALRAMPIGEAGYYQVRKQRPTEEVERAARLLYLTAHSFNGIYRVNHDGTFNVPFGGRTHRLGTPMSLEPYRRALEGAVLRAEDFEDAVSDARAGDLVYLDPPYTVMHSNNGFLKYNARVFSWSDQERLARIASQLNERGCHVVISNADHDSIRSLFGAFRVTEVSRSSRMASDVKRRGPVTELVLTNAPHGRP